MEHIARVRTIAGLWQEIHTLDPSSQVSKNFLRQLVISGKIKSVRAGNKYLIDLDAVLNYLTNPPCEETEEKSESSYGKLRRVGI